jgi:pectate lyase
MKQYVDLSLLALLIIFMYETPSFLNDIVNNTLGKLALLGGVIFLLYKFGNTSGILAALIFIILIHRKQEGFSITIAATREGATGGKKKKKKVASSASTDKKVKTEKKKKKEEKEEEKEEDTKETFKNFSSGDHIKLNDLEEVNTVPKGINFRNRTDLDRDLKINAEKNKVKATAARVDGTM